MEHCRNVRLTEVIVPEKPRPPEPDMGADLLSGTVNLESVKEKKLTCSSDPTDQSDRPDRWEIPALRARRTSPNAICLLRPLRFWRSICVAFQANDGP